LYPGQKTKEHENLVFADLKADHIRGMVGSRSFSSMLGRRNVQRRCYRKKGRSDEACSRTHGRWKAREKQREERERWMDRRTGSTNRSPSFCC
jgi:hypothetical protein